MHYTIIDLPISKLPMIIHTLNKDIPILLSCLIYSRFYAIG